jgi:hypothetical protein
MPAWLNGQKNIGYKNVRCTEVVVAYKCKYFTWGLPKKA